MNDRSTIENTFKDGKHFGKLLSDMSITTFARKYVIFILTKMYTF